MSENLLSLERWDALTPSECEAVARELSRHLPPPWQFTEVRLCRGGQNGHYIAFFDWNGNAFALIPGGEATLGYDRDNPFVLNEEQREDWEEHMEDFGGSEFEEFMDEMMTPLRTVSIEPFLIEVETKELGVRQIPISRRDTLELISQDGFRFATSNEWEYACAAGSRTLWHWGNEYPLYCYPKECKDWDLNLKPNAFGLHIATYPYNYEFCAEPEICRGGDAGASICGGYGTTVAWLALASAWISVVSMFEPDARDDKEYFQPHLRRVYSIPPGPD